MPPALRPAGPRRFRGAPGCYVPLADDLATESRAAVTAGVTTWGVHAPQTRMGDPDSSSVQAENAVELPRRDRPLHRPGRVGLGGEDLPHSCWKPTSRRRRSPSTPATAASPPQALPPVDEPSGRAELARSSRRDWPRFRRRNATTCTRSRPRGPRRRVHALRELGDRPDLRRAAARRGPHGLGDLVGSVAHFLEATHIRTYGDMAAELVVRSTSSTRRRRRAIERSSSCGAAASRSTHRRPALAAFRKGEVQRLADQRAAAFPREQPDIGARSARASSTASGPTTWSRRRRRTTTAHSTRTSGISRPASRRESKCCSR